MDSLPHIDSFKDRELHLGDQVKVYYDLHSGRFSLQKKELVYGKSDSVRLEDVSFRVSERARQEVIRTKRKNVHAKVHGRIVAHRPIEPSELLAEGYREATYNPYRYSSFVDKLTEEPLEKSASVVLHHRKIFYRG